MYRNILVPTDGSELSDKAIKQAIALAARLQARMTILTVIPPIADTFADDAFVLPPQAMARLVDGATARAQQMLEKACADARASGVECASALAVDSAPYEAIVAHAGKLACDLIVMGSHGRGGFSKALLGSETAKVLVHSTIPVLVLR
jgi:nucleotide-binding universal stress UspA family protein